MKKFLLFAMMCVLGIFTVRAQKTITIGDGTQGNYSLPTEVYYSYSFSQQSYTKAEIADAGGYAGTITSIAFKTNDAYSEGTRNLRVFMTNIDTEDEVTFDYVGNSYYQLSDLSGLVYEGAVNFVATSWNTIEFETPFVYNGNHLLVTVLDDTGSDQNDIYFDVHQKTAYDDNNNSICWATNTGNNNSAFDPTTIASSYPNGVRNNIQLTFAAAGGEEPETPELNFVATVNGQNAITLSWNAVEGAASYEIYGDASVFGLTETTYTVEGLTAGTEYCFELVALDAEWNELETAEVCATTEAASAAPAAPTNLVATANGMNSIVLTWDAVEGATDYYVYKDGQMWANTSGATTYTENGLTMGTEYCFAVQAVAELESELSETVCATTESLSEDQILIGESTTNDYAPFVTRYDGVWVEAIYKSAEIGKACTIGELAFSYKSGNETTSDVKIYLKEVTTTEFVATDVTLPESELTMVYSGTEVTLCDEAWETFVLDTPFNYSGENNLLVVVYTSNTEGVFTKWNCFEDANSVLINVTQAEYIYTSSNKPVMLLTTVEPEPAAPAVPANVVATAVGETSIALSWDAVEGATSYNIYWNGYILDSTTETNYEFTDWYTPGTTMCYTVTAVNDNGESDPSEEACATTLEPAIYTPNNFTVLATGETTIELSWSAIENAASYNIYSGEELVANLTETSYIVENLTADTEYCYAVTAFNGEVESDRTEEICVTTDKKAQELDPEATYRLLSTENYAITTYKYESETTNKVAEINADGLIDYLNYNEDGKLMGAVVCTSPYENEEGELTADTLSMIDYVYEGDVFVGYKEVAQSWGGLMTQEFDFVYNEEGQLEAVQSAGMKYLYTYNEEGLVSEMEVGYVYGEGEDAELSVESKEVYTYENGKLVTKGYYSLDWMNEGEFYLSEEAVYEYDENGNCIAENVYTIYDDEEGNEIRSLYNVTEYTYNLAISKDNAYIFEYPHLAMLDPAQPSYENAIIKTLSYYSYIDEVTGETVEHTHVKTMYYYEEYEQEVTPEPVVPAVPTNVVATAQSTSEIILSWDAVEGAISYGVYYQGSLLGTVDAPETACGFKDLSYNTEYCFQVTAINEAGESEKSEEACTKTLGESIAENANVLNIYPNPVENQLFIETEMNIVEVSVYDVYGRKLSAISNQQSAIDVAELNSGVYFVKVVTDNGETVKRFVKK